MSKKIVSLWKKLTLPSKAISDSIRRYRAVMLLPLVIVNWLFIATSSIVWMLVPPALTRHQLTIIGLMLVLLLPIYALSKSRHVRLAAWLWLIMLSTLIYAVYLGGYAAIPAQILNYLTIVMLLAGLVLSTGDMLLFLILTEMVLVGLFVLHPDPLYSLDIILPLVAGSGILTLAFTNITIRSRRQLRESEARQHDLLEANTESILLIDEQARIIDANSAFEALLGYPLDELLGHEAAHFVKPEDRRIVYKIWQEKDQTTHDLIAICKDGTPIHVEAALRPHTYRNQPAYVINIQDVTQQRLVERDRMENEQRYQALFNQTSDGVFIVDLDDVLITVNSRGCALLGYEPDELIGQPTQKIIAPDSVDAPPDILERMLKGEALPVYPCRFLRRDGSAFNGEVSASLVRDANGEPLHIQNVVRDLSEREKHEQQRFMLKLQQARNEILQDFIEQASHHFRTPIANMKTSMYLLPRLENQPGKRQRYHHILQLEVERLERLLNDLLMMTRLDKEPLQDSFLPIRAKSLLREVETHIRSEVDYDSHQWLWQVTDEKMTLYGNKQQIAEALLRIIENARRYTPVGQAIIVQNFQHGDWLTIQVQDEGIGIHENELQHIFKDFFRSEAARAQDTAGTGLGLSIADKIIKRHRGLIRVKSVVDEGSIFQIILPLGSDWSQLPHLPDGILHPESIPER